VTWRAFIIGLLGVVGLCLLVPVNDYRIGNTFLTGNHFPVGVFAFLVFLTVGVNLVLRLIRRTWMLRQTELMLVWCMMIVASTVPASGLMRNLLPTMTAAPYLAQRPDLYWESDVLPASPEGVLLSRDPRSPAATKFFEGTPEGEPVTVPWGQWRRVFVTWGIYVWLYYLATFFLCGILRRQWVDSERLVFATARVPLEFTEGARDGRLLPPLMRSKAFVFGYLLITAFGVIRLSPLFFGEESGWLPVIPFWRVFSETALHYVNVSDGKIYPIAIGFAFLVPSDVSLSIWFFYVFMCVQIIVAYSIGRPFEGGRSGPFLQWQQAGAFLTLAAGMLFMARRHLWAVVRYAVGRQALDDSEEPIGYRLAFWGLAASLAGLVAWNVYFGLGVGAAVALLVLTFTIVLVHCRMVAQGGLFFTQHHWSPSWFLHGVSGGRLFSAPAAVVATVQGQLLIHDCRELLGPHAMNALRIASVFRRRQRLFLPIMLVTLAVALAAACYSSMQWVYYDRGALNVPIGSSHVYHMRNLYEGVHLRIAKPWQSADPCWGGLATGVVGMVGLLGLRGAFYWWPVNPLGFAMAVSWCTRELWFAFFLGWLAKALALKAGGNALRHGRDFFLGVVIGEAIMVALAAFGSLLTGVRTGVIFMSH
jgi:hypothetical protein